MRSVAPRLRCTGTLGTASLKRCIKRRWRLNWNSAGSRSRLRRLSPCYRSGGTARRVGFFCHFEGLRRAHEGWWRFGCLGVAARVASPLNGNGPSGESIAVLLIEAVPPIEVSHARIGTRQARSTEREVRHENDR